VEADSAGKRSLCRVKANAEIGAGQASQETELLGKQEQVNGAPYR
jgi:hypothetical protein